MTPVAYPCACCGYLTREDPDYGTFEICPVCGWQDDSVQSSDPHYAGGPNGVTLAKARENYRAFGAKTERAKAWVRPPLPHEIPSGMTVSSGE